jgi:hypothetical protein
MRSEFDVDLVRDFYGDGDDPSSAARDALRAGLLSRIAAAETRGGMPVRHGVLRRPAGWPVLAAALAAAAVVLGLVLAGALRGGVARPDPAAAAVLQRAARSAETGGGPGVIRAGQYWYVKARFTALTRAPIGPGGAYVADVTYDVQLWEARNGSGRATTRRISVTFPTATDRRRWEQAGRPGLIAPNSTQSIRPTPRWIPVGRGLTYTQMISLPTNPLALKARLEQGSKEPARFRGAALFTTIGDLLRENPVPAPLRAALYRLAASLPGVHLYGPTRDGAGRRAIAIAYTTTNGGPPTTSELLFTPKTAELLGERGSTGKADQTTTSTYLAQGIVDRLGQLS